MVWTVTYRDDKCALKEETFEAESRSALFSELKERNITAIRIKEGFSKKTNHAMVNKLYRSLKYVAGLVLLALIVFLWCKFQNTSEERSVDYSVFSSVKNEMLPNPKLNVEIKEPSKVKTSTATNAVKKVAQSPTVISCNVTTNKSGAIVQRMTLSNGQKKMKVIPPKPIFKNVSDQVIAMVIRTKPGESVPPLPYLDKSLEQDFIDSLLTPIVINEDDSPDVKEIKALVKETKAYIANEIKNGGSLLELLKNHQAEMERTADSHAMALQEMKKIRDEFGESAAQQFIDKVNESFKDRGMAEISLNKEKKGRREN